MASTPISSPRMELLEPAQVSVTKPSPLRIIKRSQTISGVATPREVIGGRNTRGLSESSYESKGSPPMGPDRPLTIHKVRRRGTRGSVLEGLQDGSFRAQSDETIESLIRRHQNNCDDDDTDATPKAQRLTSGQALTRFQDGDQQISDENDQRTIKDTLASDNSISPFRHLEGQMDMSSPPKIPKRRLSKSKNFFRKAIGTRNVSEKPREASNSSQVPRRRLSRKKMDSGFQAESIIHVPPADVFESASQDITDVCIDPRITDYGHPSASNTSSRSLITESLILCPKITFTTETLSVDSAICTMWAAVSISGVLRNARGEVEQQSADRLQYLKESELRAYGQLYDIDMRLEPGRDCVIEEIFPSDDLSSICAGETSLFLVKVRLWKVKSGHVKESSDELLAELENRLAGTVTSYLTVQLAYRHSGHLGRRDNGNGGPLINNTRIHMECIARIKRADFKSAWSPRSSRKVDKPFGGNLLYEIIEQYFTQDIAREAMRRLSEERIPIPRARRLAVEDEERAESPESPSPDHVSEETLRANEVAAQIDSAVAVLMQEAQYDRPPSAASFKALQMIDSAAEAEGDPAREIWLSMRGNSRSLAASLSSSVTTRRSITDEDFFDARSISGTTGVSFTSCYEDLGGSGNGREDIDRERARIKEIALRNKRSVGAETLRSMAPSYYANSGKGTGRYDCYGFSSTSAFGRAYEEEDDEDRSGKGEDKKAGGRTWGWGGPRWW